MSAQVLIIGAGAAGLAAAWELAKAGLKVTVLEARSRTGGRILTHYDSAEKLPIELGAEFIHGRPPELLSIIKTARLKIEEVTARHWYVDNGELVKSGSFWATIEKLMAGMKDEIEDRPLKDYLDSLPDNEASLRAKDILLRYIEGFHAASIEKIGVQELITANEAADSIDGDHAFRVVDGYSAVTRWLRDEAATLGAHFELNAPVTNVKWQRNEVEITYQPQQRRLIGNKALITIPLALLKLDPGQEGAIEFIPGLPEWKQQSIQAMVPGSALRIVLRFTHRFWETLKIDGADSDDLANLGFIHSANAPISTWWTTLPEHEPILVGWAGGPQTEKLMKETEDQIKSDALASLAMIFRVSAEQIGQWLSSCYFHNWQIDPFSKSAYAYVPVNGLDHQIKLGRPVEETLFFAGEATSVGHVGTVHGAIQTGQRAAREILATL